MQGGTRISNRLDFENQPAQKQFSQITTYSLPLLTVYPSTAYIISAEELVKCDRLKIQLQQACQTEGPPRAIWVTFVLS